MSEYVEDLHAELGYRTAGQREVRAREWSSLRGNADEPIATPKEFAKVVNRLRVKKWSKENPERRREIAYRYALKPEHLKRSVDRDRERRHRRHRKEAKVFTCEATDCGLQWCLVPWAKRGGRPQRFCSVNCCARAKYRREHPQ